MSDKKREDDSYNLRRIFEEMELDLARSLRRNLKRHEREEEEEGFRWEMWQRAKLRNLQKYRRESKKIVDEISPEVERIVNKALEDNYHRGQNLFNRIWDRIESTFSKRKRVKFPKSIAHHKLSTPPPAEQDFFGVNRNKIEVMQEEAEKAKPQKEVPAVEKSEERPEPPKEQKTESSDKKVEGQEPKETSKPFHPDGKEKFLHETTQDNKLDNMSGQVVNDIREAQKAVWRRMDDIYRRTIYRAGMNMAAGAKTLDKAIDMATKEFLEAGIDCIEYRNGRRVNIASYAEMALRTASQRAVLLGEGKKRDEWSIHTVVVSAHANTCPLCAPWQGKVLVDDVFCHGTREEAKGLGCPLLSTAMKAGLLHPNCRHTISTYFPGITKLPEIPNKDKAIGTYNAEQQQRALERKIRKWKRKAEGSLSPENVSYANEKVGKYQEELRVHLDRHPELRREYNREKIRGVITTGHPKSVYGYENFDESHLAHDNTELLPNREYVDIPDAKISGYVLNKTHPVGKNKAIAFEKYLGYNVNNKDELLHEVYEGIKRYKCFKRAETKYGQPYEVTMVIKGANGKYARVKTGWIIDNGTNVPRLTTMYVDEG